MVLMHSDGNLVLMDAGCERHGYNADITRSWPVSGRFSDGQRDLYRAVLGVQLKCIEVRVNISKMASLQPCNACSVLTSTDN